MSRNNRPGVVQMNYKAATRRSMLSVPLMFGAAAACSSSRRIAVIPRTTGVMLWEAERSGAVAAAKKHGLEVYWNAPPREDDIEGQIALVERVRNERVAGLVLAPDQAMALMTPVRKAVESRIPVVVVSSPLPLSAQAGLSYILNDDEETGRLVARRLGQVLSGKGTVALLSLNPNLLGLMAQVKAFEVTLAREFSGLEIVDRRLGAFNGAEVQQITADVLARHPGLSALVSFTAVATRGAYLALQRRGQPGATKLVGCEQDADIIEAVARGEIDSVVAQDTYQMGYQAINAIADFRRGRAPRPRTVLQPLLITKANVASQAIRDALTSGWSHVPSPSAQTW